MSLAGRQLQMRQGQAAALPAQRRARARLAPRCQAGAKPGATASAAASAAVAVTQSSGEQHHHHHRSPAPPQQLRDPAHIGARGAASVRVAAPSTTTTDPALGLASYMTLPVEQYYILDPDQIAWVSGNRFVLSLPELRLLGASLRPVITVEVACEPDAVVLTARHCRLNALGGFGLDGLDRRFALKWSTRLTWQEEQEQEQQQGGGQPQQTQTQQTWQQRLRGSVSSSWQQQAASNGAAAAAASTSGGGGGGTISAEAFVDVWSEVLPPFHLIPRPSLMAAGSSVVSTLLSTLLPWFLRQLGDDYERWATDASYRAARAARSGGGGGGSAAAAAATTTAAAAAAAAAPAVAVGAAAQA